MRAEPGGSGARASGRASTLDRMSADELEAQLERLPRHHLFSEIPPALRGWVLPIAWDRDRLWALDLPRCRLDLGQLRWHLDLPWWRRDGVWFQLTPRDFLREPRAHPEHEERVANADLGYPPQVIRRKGRWLILDGIHRLVRAEMLGLRDMEVLTLAPADLTGIVCRPSVTGSGGSAPNPAEIARSVSGDDC